MNEIYQIINEYLINKQQLWIVTVTHNSGSIPGKTGMKMLVNKQGEIKGTIGGGVLEHWVIQRILQERPTEAVLWEYELNEEFENQTGMICGGSLMFLVEPLIQGEQLFIYGAGHCAMSLSELASKCGFLVTVIDDRAEWANKEKHPFAFNIINCDFDKILDYIKSGAKDYHIIMTHGHRNDEKILKILIDQNLFFLGMLGSKQKVKITFDNLIKQGISDKLLNKIHAPVGIPIGSHEPMEIAVSIMAELIKERSDSVRPHRNQEMK